jgi:diamine N-acetyltransferase
MNVQIERVDARAIPVIREMTERIWYPTYEPIIGAEQIKYMLGRFYAPEVLAEQIGSGSQEYYMCTADGAPVGFAAVSDEGGDRCKLNKLYVLPGTQGQGTGRMLLDRVRARAIELGANCLYLNVNRHNEKAIRFYEKYGFRRAGVEDIDIGDGYFMNDYVYEIAL